MKASCLFISLLLAIQINTSRVDMDAKALSSAVAKFSAKFCNELNKFESVVSSPLSAEYLLALLALGTTGQAHTELLTSLEIPDDDSIRPAFSEASSKFKSIQGITLNVANKVYLKEGPYELNPELKEDAVKVFDASFEKLNFNDGPGSANIINKWVESKTNDRIKDLLSSDSINGDTRLVLVNALYFKGMWKSQFSKSNTMDQPFHIDANTTVDVPMMYKEDNYKYAECPGLQAQILEMEYMGGQASMIIVLPNEIEGLNGIMQKLAEGYDLMSELNKLYSTKVQVTIPKFKIETEIDLMEILPKIGINAIFQRGNSGLTKILDNNEPLYVSKAVQKAFIEVNEEGAEAAAATGVVIMLRCARPPTPRFRADRPFLYLLTGSDHTTLFIGVYRKA
uniref:Serpin 2 n=1 Tax=Lonomia obliqua TaxID=304329 RepID=Q5MGH1_LONON|nr:serpin 2 [Lonomia obliqua]